MPKDWFLTSESHPTNIQNDIVNLDYIQQYMDVTVKINFGEPQPFRLKT